MAGKQRARPIRVVFSEKFRRSPRHIFVWPPWWLAQKAVFCHPVEVFERVVDAINNVDVSDRNVSSVIDARTPKSQRIAILEKELKFYRDRIREISDHGSHGNSSRNTFAFKTHYTNKSQKGRTKFAWTHHQETRK